MRTNYPRHLPAFPYVGFHRYFLTFCTQDRTRVFVRDSTTELVWSQFLRAARQEAFAITACCFMPDHVHLLVEGESDASDLKRFLARAKQFSGYYYARAHGASLWQRYGHEHVLRDDEKTKSVVAYILENPVRASLVRAVHEYRHVRSSRYSVKELIEFAYARSGQSRTLPTSVRLKPDATEISPAEAGRYRGCGGPASTIRLMHTESHQWLTHRLGRPMGIRVYGHWGMPILAFPTSGGDEWELEGQSMVGALAEFIDGGRIKLFCVGSNGDQSFYNKHAHPLHRSWMQKQWDEYIRWEVIPFIHSHCRGLPAILTMGASLGAYHAANTCFKHPDAVRGCFALSGLYDMRRFMDGFTDDNFYFNNPIDYIGGMNDPHLIGLISSANIHIATGHGPWEHPSHSYDLSRALSVKGIRHHLDDWGPLGGHDWPYWKHQMREYLRGI